MDKLNDLKVMKFTTKEIDLNGRKVVNAGDAVNPQDYVTKSQMDEAIASLKKELTK